MQHSAIRLRLYVCVLISAAAAAFSPSKGQAGDIYMGVDENGIITFTDTPKAGDTGFDVYIKDLSDGRPEAMAPVDSALLRENLDNYDAEILRAARMFGVVPELLKAMILVESGMNPDALSPRGAQGLMQLMPATAEELGVQDPLDPFQNIQGGARYIKRMQRRFGNQELAIAAYNAGPGNVEKYGGIPPFEETQFYVRKVLKYYRFFVTERPLR